jgi:hypothetical protein
MNIWLLRPGVELQDFGELPKYLDETDERPAVTQLGACWQPIGGLFRLEGSKLCGIGGSPHELLGAIHLLRELVMLFEGDLIAVVQSDRSLEVGQIALVREASTAIAAE